MISQRYRHHLGTFLTVTSYGTYRTGAALCSDGRVRRFHRIAPSPDTFFSVPASVKVRGHIVSGFAGIDHDESGRSIVKFTANQAGRNAHLLPEWKRIDLPAMVSMAETYPHLTEL